MKRVVIGLVGCTALTVLAQTCLVCGEIRSVREIGAQQRDSTPRQVGSPSGLDSGPAGPVVGTVAVEAK